jgi:muramoyltetrapeptide carboxypeptidase
LLADRDVRAIVVARGGYGLARILPRLDPELLRRDPKPIVGFSDATALLAWAHHAGVRAIHGPVVAQLGELADRDVDRLIAMLTDPTPPIPWVLDVFAKTVVRGPLVATNLTLASVLVGTPWPVPLAGAIAVFEEVGERPYEIDRYFTHLALAGALAEPAAIVIGDFTRCVDPNPPTGTPDPDDAATSTVRERLLHVNKPFALGAPIGHGSRNEAVPFGAPCELDPERNTLTFLEGAVS